MSIKFYPVYDWCRHIDISVAPEDWIINGIPVPKKRFADMRRIVTLYINCPYCSKPLRKSVLPEDAITNLKMKHKDIGEHLFDFSITVCVSCGFWTATSEIGRGSFGLVEHSYAAAVKRIFPIDAPKVPLNELTEYIRRNPDLVYNMNATMFEKLVGDCFRKNWGAVDVIHVGQTNDGGKDLILVMEDEKRWLVQCKRRKSSSKTESVKTVRELLGTLIAEKALNGIVVSTADHFSYAAEKLTTNPNVMESGFTVKLIDFGILKEMLAGAPRGPLIEKRDSDQIINIVIDGPWQSFLTNPWRNDNNQKI